MSDGEKSQGNGGLGDNIWILIPLAALSIPIFAVVNDGPLVWVLGAVIVLVALTLAARSLMTHRHELRIRELEAQERIVRAERDQLSAAERLLELDDLGRAVREPNDPHTA